MRKPSIAPPGPPRDSQSSIRTTQPTPIIDAESEREVLDRAQVPVEPFARHQNFNRSRTGAASFWGTTMKTLSYSVSPIVTGVATLSARQQLGHGVRVADDERAVARRQRRQARTPAPARRRPAAAAASGAARRPAAWPFRWCAAARR